MSWSLRRRLAGLFGAALLAFVVAALAATAAMGNLLEARRTIVDRVDPAAILARDLLAAYVNEETAVRGFVLGNREEFLEPYVEARVAEGQLAERLDTLLAHEPVLTAELEQVKADAARWQAEEAEPAIAARRAGDESFGTPEALLAAKSSFDEIRRSSAALDDAFTARRHEARRALDRATVVLGGVMAAGALVIALLGVAIWRGLRVWVVLPLRRLGDDATQVAGGDLAHPVVPSGPPEVVELGGAMDAMRTRLADELQAVRAAQAELSEANLELARSNVELEQFAYVASHDLQEPLRKVASFCQLLQRRYQGQLDERADQYIAFAVDGATRMQRLINDLLAFSRVGRSSERMQLVPLEDSLAEATGNLSEVIEASRATVVAGPLPTVRGDPALLVALFQNLLGNSMKFRSEDPPRITITATEADGRWELCATDNGIGIEPRFAERVFVIFQRLHPKESYEGTGIGLALCRKIVEFHGGTMWIDTDHQSGARICWTFPLPTEEPTPP